MGCGGFSVEHAVDKGKGDAGAPDRALGVTGLAAESGIGPNLRSVMSAGYMFVQKARYNFQCGNYSPAPPFMDDTDSNWCAVCDRQIVPKRTIVPIQLNNPPPSPNHDSSQSLFVLSLPHLC